MEKTPSSSHTVVDTNGASGGQAFQVSLGDRKRHLQTVPSSNAVAADSDGHMFPKDVGFTVDRPVQQYWYHPGTRTYCYTSLQSVGFCRLVAGKVVQS